MTPSVFRIAHRWLTKEAGVLEAPPAMYAAIYEWILATVAVTHVKGIEARIQQLQTIGRKETTASMRPVEDACAALEAAPSNWKAYKALYDALWAFGHPGTRWSVKDFQKMTPEKRTLLEQRVGELIAYAREQIADRLGHVDFNIAKEEKELTRLRPYIRPGVKALPESGEAKRKFPVDLTGWQYGTDLDERIEERLKELWGRLEDKTKPEFKAEIREMVEFQLKTYRFIKVKISSESIRNARAYWNERDRELWVKLPHGVQPYQLEDLGGSIRHELQHFAQTYLGFALTGIQESVWKEIREKHRIPRPGMPSRHIMTVHPNLPKTVDQDFEPVPN